MSILKKLILAGPENYELGTKAAITADFTLNFF